MQLQARKDLPFFFFFVNNELNNFWGIGSVRQLRGHVGRCGSASQNGRFWDVVLLLLFFWNGNCILVGT